MEQLKPSPRWNITIKLVVMLTLLAIVAGLLIKFQGMLPPLIVTVILAYLFNPMADFISSKLHIAWKAAVLVVYALAVLLLFGLLAVGGVSLARQAQSMINLITDSLLNLPAALENISGRVLTVGPFAFDMRQIDLGVLSQQVISTIEPLLGRTGSMVGAVAGGAANFLGWTFFVLLVSYFVLAESDGLWRGILQVNIPGYEYDLEQMGKQIAQIWNAFLRGQLMVMGFAAIIYTVLLGSLGVSYALGLALLAGLARFVPYVGAFTMWVTLALVTYFQEFKLFGMDAWAYSLLVVGSAWVIDAILDNFVMPSVMASTLKVHPAAVMVAAIVSLDLLGILGVIIAAPMLATLQLVGHYFTRKLFDLDPWAGLDDAPPAVSPWRKISLWLRSLRVKLKLG